MEGEAGRGAGGRGELLRAHPQALQEHRAEGGVEGRGARYRRNCELLVSGMRALGFKTLLPDALQAPIIVTFRMPSDPRFEFQAFYDALCAAERVPLREFEKPRYFEGCLPIEVMADRGVDTLRYGPMKPVGLPDPRTGKDAYAVVQLRRENVAGTAWNLVGFQTKLKYPEQLRVFRMVPGLESVSFLRMGSIHRNTFIHSPSLLDGANRLLSNPRVRFAGQITGVEGYVESTASGLLTALYLAAELEGAQMPEPPPETAFGAMMSHVHGPEYVDYQPHNIHCGLFPPLGRKLKKRERKEAYGARARARLSDWLAAWPFEVVSSPKGP